MQSDFSFMAENINLQNTSCLPKKISCISGMYQPNTKAWLFDYSLRIFSCFVSGYHF